MNTVPGVLLKIIPQSQKTLFLFVLGHAKDRRMVAETEENEVFSMLGTLVPKMKCRVGLEKRSMPLLLLEVKKKFYSICLRVLLKDPIDEM